MSTTKTDRELDQATAGRKGTARAGFHLVFRAVRGVTADGTPTRRNVTERCTCAAKANHAA